MSITDELREWAEGNTLRAGMSLRTARDQALAIADRIDAEHEEKVSYWQGACYEDGYKEGLADNEDAMAEHGWVKLPVDADGEVIHIGDRVENNERVVRIVLTDGSCEPSVYIEKLPNVLHECFCNEISHYHEPTVEDVLTKMLEQAVGYSDAHTTVSANAIVEYAAKLRLAGDAE